MALIDCPYCTVQHGDKLLCEPARRVLDALIDRGMSFQMPTLEFPEPVQGIFGGGDLALVQFVAQGGIVDVGGIFRPVLVIGGRKPDGVPAPSYVYASSPDGLRETGQLVSEMIELAIRRADEANH